MLENKLGITSSSELAEQEEKITKIEEENQLVHILIESLDEESKFIIMQKHC